LRKEIFRGERLEGIIGGNLVGKHTREGPETSWGSAIVEREGKEKENSEAGHYFILCYSTSNIKSFWQRWSSALAYGNASKPNEE